MKLHSDSGASGNRITAYGPGHFVVNDTRFTSCLMITSALVDSDWGLRHIDELNAETIDRLRGLEAEILLIGTGDTHIFPDPEVLSRLSAPRTGVEVMTTQAACRTFNILAAEGRNVAALLIPLADSSAS